MPDELKSHDFVKTFTKPGDFVKSALEIKAKHDDLESKLANALIKPGEGAKEEDVRAFYKALGVPDKPEEYEMKPVEGAEHDEKVKAWSRGIFHKANLTKDQAEIISREYDVYLTEFMKSQDEASVAAKTEAEGKLKTEWGNEYDKNLEITRRGFQKFSDTEFAKFLDETGVGNNPVLIKAFYKIGLALAEDNSPTGKAADGKDNKPIGMIYKDMPTYT